MKKSLLILIAIGVLIVVAIFAGMGSYNGLVASETAVENKFSVIEVQLQRRLELIPNLVETVKGFAAQEKEILQSIADARSNLAGARTPGELSEADAQLSGALSRLLVIVENYPNLKSDAQFTGLRDELAGTENRIAVARIDYNDVVTTHNVKIRKFPTAIFAGIFGFEKKEFFKAAPGSEQAPEVKF